jgi:hypothetical protein
MSDDTKPDHELTTKRLSPVIIEGPNGHRVAVMKADPLGSYLHMFDAMPAHPDLTRVTVVGEGVMDQLREFIGAIHQRAYRALSLDRSEENIRVYEATVAALALLPSATVKE